ncbi:MULTISPECIES: hypothetical protein [unclassified Streptomyces]|uniref:hypothetical protein n=1 Tax=unclassified Streptomyces TaxID=2593676 RepID=UPI0006FBCD28|nr:MULTISPECIES: hypothetical protein [unclassified Streptomyces]KQX58753.1 hypothetical protein ASD33_00090 [Streptomyces sp. Root1304]KRB00014.1 hypothetical protein ASE09_00090 [Streptomyces sp. Root66D1]
MASHRKLRAAAVVCAVAVVAGPAPAAAWAATAGAPAAAPALTTPSPDPFSGLTADEIGDKAVAATRSATSLRMTGRLTADGRPLAIDFAVNDHDECTGVMKIKGGTAELRKVGGITYLKGDEAFWRASMTSQGMPPAQIDATIELVKGRWLKIGPGQAGSADLGGVCDLKALLSDLDKDKGERRGLTRGPDAEVDGTPVATLVKKKADGETTSVSVSQEGKPYILKMVKKGGDEPGALVLSDYDKPVKVEIPPASETVDLSKLDQGQPA